MGPSASILLREQLSETDRTMLDQMIDRISSRRNANEFCVKTTKPIGGVFEEIVGDSFVIDIQNLRDGQSEYEETELKIIKRSIGFEPVQSIQVGALFKGDQMHQILAEVCLHLCKTFNGFVDFHGAILPTHSALPDGMRRAMVSYEMHWSDVASYFEKEKSKLPGQLHAIEYQVTPRRSWACQIGDSEFLESWISHPNFHMIK